MWIVDGADRQGLKFVPLKRIDNAEVEVYIDKSNREGPAFLLRRVCHASPKVLVTYPFFDQPGSREGEPTSLI